MEPIDESESVHTSCKKSDRFGFSSSDILSERSARPVDIFFSSSLARFGVDTCRDIDLGVTVELDRF